jgi:hypothetical protein
VVLKENNFSVKKIDSIVISKKGAPMIYIRNLPDYQLLIDNPGTPTQDHQFLSCFRFGE